MIREVEPKLYHCGRMARHLRRDQALALDGINAHEQLRDAFKNSSWVAAYELDGRLVALGGMHGLGNGMMDTMLSTEGFIWLALTDEVVHCQRTLVKECRRHLARLARTRSRISTLIFADDKPSAAFAHHLGFLTERTEKSAQGQTIRIMRYTDLARRAA